MPRLFACRSVENTRRGSPDDTGSTATTPHAFGAVDPPVLCASRAAILNRLGLLRPSGLAFGSSWTDRCTAASGWNRCFSYHC